MSSEIIFHNRGKDAQIHRFDAKNPKGTVILVQGWNCRAGELEGLARVLANNGYNARTFENPGVGDTKLQGTTAKDYFAHAAAIIAEACIQDAVVRPRIVTHSMGGYIANAYLSLATELGGTFNPSALYEITPGKALPTQTLPTGHMVFQTTGWATKLLINLSRIRAEKAENDPTEINEKLSKLSLKTMLHAFDVLAPIMIKIIGGSDEAAAEFGKYTQEALGFDPKLSAMQVLAMCKYTPSLEGVRLPAHIRHIYGEHDIFIGANESIPKARKMFERDGTNFEVRVLPTGHFPHRENPNLLIEDMLGFFERV